jgi:ABC-type lipoprotein export system ATPase subunit
MARNPINFPAQMTTPTAPVLQADALVHRRSAQPLLDGVSLSIQPGAFTLLCGPADSGAGLLLRILGLLEAPDSGAVLLDAQPASALEDAARVDLRNRNFGFLFAEPFLLDSFSIAENVAMPLFKIAGFDIEQARARTTEVLRFAGIEAMADLGVADIDPVDYHKIALARALAVSPRVLIAEDFALQLPTREVAEFAALLHSIPQRFGIAVVATSPIHPETLAPDREVQLERGIIVDDSHPYPLQEAPAHD